nr:hypothetical protein [Dinophyceae sp. MRD-151]
MGIVLIRLKGEDRCSITQGIIFHLPKNRILILFLISYLEMVYFLVRWVQMNSLHYPGS